MDSPRGREAVELAKVAAPIYAAFIAADAREVPMDVVVAEIEQIGARAISHALMLIEQARLRCDL